MRWIAGLSLLVLGLTSPARGDVALMPTPQAAPPLAMPHAPTGPPPRQDELQRIVEANRGAPLAADVLVAEQKLDVHLYPRSVRISSRTVLSVGDDAPESVLLGIPLEHPFAPGLAANMLRVRGQDEPIPLSTQVLEAPYVDGRGRDRRGSWKLATFRVPLGAPRVVVTLEAYWTSVPLGPGTFSHTGFGSGLYGARQRAPGVSVDVVIHGHGVDLDEVLARNDHWPSAPGVGGSSPMAAIPRRRGAVLRMEVTDGNYLLVRWPSASGGLDEPAELASAPPLVRMVERTLRLIVSGRATSDELTFREAQEAPGQRLGVQRWLELTADLRRDALRPASRRRDAARRVLWALRQEALEVAPSDGSDTQEFLDEAPEEPPSDWNARAEFAPWLSPDGRKARLVDTDCGNSDGPCGLTLEPGVRGALSALHYHEAIEGPYRRAVVVTYLALFALLGWLAVRRRR